MTSSSSSASFSFTYFRCWCSVHRHCAITSLYSLSSVINPLSLNAENVIYVTRGRSSRFRTNGYACRTIHQKCDSLKPFVIASYWRFNHFLVKLTLARKSLVNVGGFLLSFCFFTERRAHKSRRSRQKYYQLQHREWTETDWEKPGQDIISNCHTET